MGHATGEKILSRLLLLGQFGQEGGIYFRTPFTTAEAAAIDRIREWMQEVGLTVRRDAVGNLIGRIQGRDRSAAFHPFLDGAGARVVRRRPTEFPQTRAALARLSRPA